MNENIDLTKILKDCPKGTKFYSAIDGDIEFWEIIEKTNYPILTDKSTYTKKGTEYIDRGECVLFPSKEQRDWSKFVPTWKQEKQKVKVTIHPFDRMLFRHTAEMKWRGTIITNYDKMYTSSEYIPYNKDTAHLLGTTDDCPIDYEIEFSKEYKKEEIMKKEIIKPFDLEAWKNGAKVKTRDGHEVRFICTDRKDQYFPIIALVKLYDNDESIISYTSEGKEYNDSHNIEPNDLVIVEEIEEPEFWSDKENEVIEGHYISLDSTISPFCTNINANNYGLFATHKQAKSALAMARISQIMANDIENFGGIVTDEEWDNDEYKYVIDRHGYVIGKSCAVSTYYFLAFHTEAQRDLFLKKYRNLVKDYLMID